MNYRIAGGCNGYPADCMCIVHSPDGSTFMRVINAEMHDVCQVLLDDDQMLPKFRANVDVSLFTSPSSTINVSVNPLTQKVLIEASTNPAEPPVRTLRQYITLPRFADEKNIEHSVNADGILEVIRVLFVMRYFTQQLPLKFITVPQRWLFGSVLVRASDL